MAVYWFKLSAAQGHLDAINNLGVMFDQGLGVAEDDAAAVKLFRTAAERSHPRAMNNLGRMLQKGEGVPQDYRAAAEWFEKASARGDMEARNNFAVMLDNGWGVTADPVVALRLFAEAARAGETRAQVNLGKKLLADSRPESLLAAYAWLNVASSSGDSEAKDIKAAAASRLTADQLREAQRLSRTITETV